MDERCPVLPLTMPLFPNLRSETLSEDIPPLFPPVGFCTFQLSRRNCEAVRCLIELYASLAPAIWLADCLGSKRSQNALTMANLAVQGGRCHQ